MTVRLHRETLLNSHILLWEEREPPPLFRAQSTWAFLGVVGVGSRENGWKQHRAGSSGNSSRYPSSDTEERNV